MRSLSPTPSQRVGNPLARPLKAFAHEALAFFDAITSPARIIAEVQEMRSLQVEADRIAATDPACAAVLRARASRIGLN